MILRLTLAFIAILALAGCQLPARTKAEARQHQVGEPFVVSAPLAVVVRYWDEHALRPMKIGAMLDVSPASSLRFYESLGIAEIYDGNEDMIQAMIELRATSDGKTMVTTYQPVSYLGGTKQLNVWLDVIRSTPPSPAAQKTP